GHQSDARAGKPAHAAGHAAARDRHPAGGELDPSRGRERLMRARRFQRATAAQRLSALAGFALLALLLLASRDAAAYPQFQFSSGTTRCGQCHVEPGDTCVINDWGRGEAGDTISRGGDGAFLHGLWTPPSWVAL